MNSKDQRDYDLKHQHLRVFGHSYPMHAHMLSATIKVYGNLHPTQREFTVFTPHFFPSK